jgi:hypothetical protein
MGMRRDGFDCVSPRTGMGVLLDHDINVEKTVKIDIRSRMAMVGHHNNVARVGAGMCMRNYSTTDVGIIVQFYKPTPIVTTGVMIMMPSRERISPERIEGMRCVVLHIVVVDRLVPYG